MYHIYGHLDELLREDQMTIEEKTNCMADRLVTEALVDGVASETYISDNFPFEDTCLYVKGRRVTGSPKKAIYNFWSEKVAIKLFHERRIVSKYDFHLIYWDGMEPALRPFSEMFQVWVTKHISHFCGTNRQLSRWDTSIKNECPSCGRPNETTSHITQCRHEGRTKMFQLSVDRLVAWLEQHRTCDDLVRMVRDYLLGRGDKTMLSIIGANHTWAPLAKFHDRPGWDNFVEGRICKLWLQARQEDIDHHNIRSTAEFWARGLMRKLLELTHRQWIYRNSYIHYKTPDGLSLRDHDRIMQQAESLMDTDPMELLPEHRALLDIDFEKLGEDAAMDRQLWVAEMESAVSAADHARRGSYQTLKTRFCTGPTSRLRRAGEVATVDNEGSIRWRRRRKRS